MQKTHLESWPARLFHESVATIIFQLTEEERNSLVQTNATTVENNQQEPPGEAINVVDQLSAKIDGYIRSFPNGAFVKFGSRSPKDSWIGYQQGFRCTGGRKAIQLFNDSERICDDLHMAQYNDYLPYVAIREWVDIPKWSEFRGIIKDRQLVGLSQYNYLGRKVYSEIIENANAIELAIRQKVDRIADLLPMPDIVADFYYKPDGEVTLIELNPYDFWTDPCLFDWKEDDFSSFQFRYIEAIAKTS